MKLLRNFNKLFIAILLMGLIISCGSDDEPTPPPTLSAPTVTGSFQPEGQLSISFTITGTFQTGNVFTAQLSDATGSFTNPILIGTLNSLKEGTINATLPASVATGNAYRIRVVASAPATTSPDNGANLSITAPAIDITSISNPNNLTPGISIGISFTIEGTFKTGNVFTAQLSDGTGSFSNPTSIGTLNSLTGGTINATIPASLPEGNAYRIRVKSSAPEIISPDNGSNLSIALPTITISSFNTTPQANATFIADRNVAIVTATTRTFASNNLFRIQLSDATGNFTNATNIYEGTTLSPTQIVKLPSNVAVGTGYRFRITTTSPAITSAPSSAFSIVALSFSAPTITGNLVLGGNTNITVTINNGPTLSGDVVYKVQLSDASGNFINPTELASLINPQATQVSTVTLPTNITPGNGYKLRAVLTNSAGSALYVGPAANISIGALPTITITEATPVFTRMYSSQLNPARYFYYVFNVQGSGSFNPNTIFAFQAQGVGEPFGSPVIQYGGLVSSTLLANGTVTAFVGMRNVPAGPVKFRVTAIGHSVNSNEKTYTVYSTTLTGLTASIDNESYNFNIDRSISNSASTVSGANNQSLFLSGDAPYSLYGATRIRAFIGINFTNQEITAGSKTITFAVQLLNSNGQLIGTYSNGSINATVTGNASDGFNCTLGTLTLTKFGTFTGPATLSVQSGSFSFEME